MPSGWDRARYHPPEGWQRSEQQPAAEVSIEGPARGGIEHSPASTLAGMTFRRVSQWLKKYYCEGEVLWESDDRRREVAPRLCAALSGDEKKPPLLPPLTSISAEYYSDQWDN